MIRRWIIPICGFKQRGAEHCGMDDIWLMCRQLSSPETCVHSPLEWSQNMEDVAARIRRLSNVSPQVAVVAYSWGCGHGFIKLAEELEVRGIRVAHAVLCDPVYRTRWIPTWLPINPMSLTRLPRLKLPFNVNVVEWCYQRDNRPQGHELVARPGSGTDVRKGVLVKDTRHNAMDESEEFRQLVRRALL